MHPLRQADKSGTVLQGVNLPAHLVIIKGTQRYCSDASKGTTCGYQEYELGECLQMIGRAGTSCSQGLCVVSGVAPYPVAGRLTMCAGRPQFDDSAVAVIMTQQQHVHRYENLARGHQQVESKLHLTLPEFLNAEVAMRVVTNMDQADQWLQTTFFWVRLFQNPQFYRLPVIQGEVWQNALTDEAKRVYLQAALLKLQETGMISMNAATGAVTPLEPGTYAPLHLSPGGHPEFKACPSNAATASAHSLSTHPFVLQANVQELHTARYYGTDPECTVCYFCEGPASGVGHLDGNARLVHARCPCTRVGQACGPSTR